MKHARLFVYLRDIDNSTRFDVIKLSEDDIAIFDNTEKGREMRDKYVQAYGIPYISGLTLSEIQARFGGNYYLIPEYGQPIHKVMLRISAFTLKELVEAIRKYGSTQNILPRILYIVGDREWISYDARVPFLKIDDRLAIMCDYTSIGIEACFGNATAIKNYEIFKETTVRDVLQTLGSGWKIETFDYYTISKVLKKYNIKTTDDLMNALAKYGKISL